MRKKYGLVIALSAGLTFSAPLVGVVHAQPITLNQGLPQPFIIDHNQDNIEISNLQLTFVASGGTVQWTIVYDQYNKTHANSTPNNATLYIYLLDNSGHRIPGPPLTYNPDHTFCHHRYVQSPSGITTRGFPSTIDLQTVATAIELANENITYRVDNC